VVEVPIRNQSLSACGFFHISTALFKERKRSKKKETAATVLSSFAYLNPALNTYKKCAQTDSPKSLVRHTDYLSKWIG
jgi:hypothetical protein